MKEKILIIEDDPKISRLIEIELKFEGFEVSFAYDGKEGLNSAKYNSYDLIILDLMLPKMNGIEVCKRIREFSEVPIIMLTAKDEISDKVVGLDYGADDYMTKPFGMMELVSRIKAVLRRSGRVQEQDMLSVNGVSVDVKKHEVKVAGEIVTLTLKEFELLERLMRNQNIVLTRDQLLEDIWGYDFDGETRTVDVHVRTLRQKLGEKGDIIKTVRGVGYRIGGGNEG